MQRNSKTRTPAAFLWILLAFVLLLWYATSASNEDDAPGSAREEGQSVMQDPVVNTPWPRATQPGSARPTAAIGERAAATEQTFGPISTESPEAASEPVSTVEPDLGGEEQAETGGEIALPQPELKDGPLAAAVESSAMAPELAGPLYGTPQPQHQPLVLTEGQARPRTSEFRWCGWALTFADHFEEDSLNLERWDTGYKAGDHEAQYYEDDVFEVQDGILRIRAEQRQVGDRKYASGIITTEGIFAQRYGHFEARVKTPAGQGLWPAFWLLPYPPNYPVEIDVFEILGHEPGTAYMTNHWRSEERRHDFHTYGYRGPDFSQDFHVFGATWTAEEIVWYIDGVERARERRGIPHDEMFLLLNLAVGGKWPGYPDDTTPFPSYLEIDYVRVYSWTCPEGLEAGSDSPWSALE